MADKHDNDVNFEEDFDVVNDENENGVEKAISPTDPEWSDYVLSLFAENELYEGSPTVDGLRRVTTELIGHIDECLTHVVQPPNPNTGDRAVVVVTLIIGESKYSGAADASSVNSKPPYDKHPVALAETRAEGRALKRALLLRNVNSAEEMNVTPTVNTEKITPTQIRFIELMASRLDINVQKFLETEGCKNINNLSYDDALKINAKLTSFQNKSEVVSDEIKGYEN